MCTLDAAMIGISAVGTGFGMIQSGQQASAQNQYQQQVYANQQAQYSQDMAHREAVIAHQLDTHYENRDRVVASAGRNYAEIAQRMGEEAAVAGMEIQEIVNASRSVSATQMGTDAERGVEGASVEYLLDSIKMNELQNVEKVRREQDWRIRAHMGMMDEVEARAQAQIDSTTPGPVPLPNLPPPMAPQAQGMNPFAALLSFGANALDIYSKNYDPELAGLTQQPTASNLYQSRYSSWYQGYGDKGWRNQSWGW